MAKQPATAFVRTLANDGHNIIHWAARLSAGGRASEAAAQLQRLQGIGPKIAAFFLRDVVTSHGISEGHLGDRRSILPIDVWVRRGVAVLIDRPELAREGRDAQTAAEAIAWADRAESE